MEAYFVAHSKAYRSLESRAHEGFWRAFLPWGPAPGLFPPALLLESVILHEDSANLADRLEC